MGGCFSCEGVGCQPVLSLFTCLFPVPQEEVRQAVTPAEPVQYYFTLAQQPAAVQVQGQQQGQQTTTATTTIQPGQIIIAQPQQGQVSGEQQSGVVCIALCSLLRTVNNNTEMCFLVVIKARFLNNKGHLGPGFPLW